MMARPKQRMGAHSLEELIAEQGRLAPFRRDVPICWDFLAKEIKAMKGRGEPAPRARPTSATSRSRSPPPRSRSPPQRSPMRLPPKSPVMEARAPERTPPTPVASPVATAHEAVVPGPAPAAAPRGLWKTGVGLLKGDPAPEAAAGDDAAAAGAEAAAGPEAVAEREAGLGAAAPPMGRFQKALAEKAGTQRRLEAGGGGVGIAGRPSWGVGTKGAGDPLSPSPSTRRLQQKKASLAKYSVVGQVEDRIRAERRASLREAEDARARAAEAAAMRAEERSQLARTFHRVASDSVFYMKAHAFLLTTVFLNHKRDYLVCVCRGDTMDVFEPVLFKEADLVRATKLSHAKAGRGVAERVEAAAPTAPAAGDADLRRPPPLPPFAAHYLFKCGRLTMTGAPPTRRITLIGVDTFSLRDALNSGQYGDPASFGDFKGRALDGWHPNFNEGEDLRASFVSALKEAKATVVLNAPDHDVIQRSSERVRRHSDSLAAMHRSDAKILDDLVDGYAPTQLRDLRRAPNMRPKSAAASTPGHRSRVLAPVAANANANANANAARPPRAATATATSARAVYAQENAPRKQPPRRQYTPKRADRASSPDFGSSPRTPGGSRPKSAPAARRKPPPMARA